MKKKINIKKSSKWKLHLAARSYVCLVQLIIKLTRTTTTTTTAVTEKWDDKTKFIECDECIVVAYAEETGWCTYTQHTCAGTYYDEKLCQRNETKWENFCVLTFLLTFLNESNCKRKEIIAFLFLHLVLEQFEVVSFSFFFLILLPFVLLPRYLWTMDLNDVYTMQFCSFPILHPILRGKLRSFSLLHIVVCALLDGRYEFSFLIISIKVWPHVCIFMTVQSVLTFDSFHHRRVSF